MAKTLEQPNNNELSVEISLVDVSVDSDESLNFEETTEEAQMLSIENLYEQRNGYENGEYGSLLKRLMTNRTRADSMSDELSTF